MEILSKFIGLPLQTQFILILVFGYFLYYLNLKFLKPYLKKIKDNFNKAEMIEKMLEDEEIKLKNELKKYENINIEKTQNINKSIETIKNGILAVQTIKEENNKVIKIFKRLRMLKDDFSKVVTEKEMITIDKNYYRIGNTLYLYQIGDKFGVVENEKTNTYKLLLLRNNEIISLFESSQMDCLNELKRHYKEFIERNGVINNEK